MADKFNYDPSMFHRVANVMPLNKPVSNAQIYQLVSQDGRPLTGEWEASIRRILQAHCRESPQYQGDHYFDNPQRGVWLRVKDCPDDLDDLNDLDD